MRYVFDDDRDSTSNTELVEGIHFWWVPISVFSKAYYEHVDREAAETAAAADIGPNDVPHVRPAQTPVQVKKSAFLLLYDVQSSEKYDPISNVMKPGHLHTCLAPGCGKKYFVGKGVERSPRVFASFFFLLWYNAPLRPLLPHSFSSNTGGSNGNSWNHSEKKHPDFCG